MNQEEIDAIMKAATEPKGEVKMGKIKITAMGGNPHDAEAVIRKNIDYTDNEEINVMVMLEQISKGSPQIFPLKNAEEVLTQLREAGATAEIPPEPVVPQPKKEEFTVEVHIRDDQTDALFDFEEKVYGLNRDYAKTKELIGYAKKGRLVLKCINTEEQIQRVEALEEIGITDIICNPPLPRELITFVDEEPAANKPILSQDEVNALLNISSDDEEKVGNPVADLILSRMEEVTKAEVEAFMLEHKDEFKGDRGNDGSDGVDGKPGTKGTDGRPGTNGTNGNNGDQGDRGFAGKSVPGWIIWIAGIAAVAFLIFVFVIAPTWVHSWKDDAISAAVKATSADAEKKIAPTTQQGATIKVVPIVPKKTTISQPPSLNKNVNPSDYDQP